MIPEGIDHCAYGGSVQRAALTAGDTVLVIE